MPFPFIFGFCLLFAGPCVIIIMDNYVPCTAERLRQMTERTRFGEKFYISTIADDCLEQALRCGAGVEIADFCWAQHIDVGAEDRLARCEALLGAVSHSDRPRGVFHAPFAELAPCAIDPRARELAKLRYTQSVTLAQRLRLRRLVIHGGFIPEVYYPEYYVEQSVLFWKEFLRDLPADMEIMLENVMEPSPDTLVSIVRGVDDPRLGLCLDVGHANCSVSRVPPEQWLTAEAPYLMHVHIHNNEGDRDLHSPLGKGSIPMESLICEALSLCPGATFTLENMHAAGSVDWLIEKGFLNIE